MSDEKISVPKDEVNGNFLCCFPTRSWNGERINGCRVVEKSYDEKGQIFTLRLKGQKVAIILTKDLVKSLYWYRIEDDTEDGSLDATDGFVDFKNEAVNGSKVVNKSFVEKKVKGCQQVNKSYVENGPSFILNLNGQVEPVTVSRVLVLSLFAMTTEEQWNK